MESRSVFLADAAETQALGRELAAAWMQVVGMAVEPAAARPILLLEGDLGAGKTCLVQGLAQGLGIHEAITSPTFALAQHYRGRLEPNEQGQGPAAGLETTLVHLDLYRLEQPAAADELFAQEEEEALALGALMAVEWSGRLSFVPEGAWRVQLQLQDPDDPEAGRTAQLQVVEAR